MTRPGSQYKYRIEYPNGNEKWVRERPGHKSDKWKIREKKKVLRDPAVREFLGRFTYVVNSYIAEEADEDAIRKVVRDFETTRGWNKARSVVRRVKRSESKKLEKAEGDAKEWQQKIVDAVDIAVEFVGRRRRDKKDKEAALGTNREYKTRNRYIKDNLAKHAERMKELMAQGLTKEQASKQAYDELFGSKKAYDQQDYYADMEFPEGEGPRVANDLSQSGQAGEQNMSVRASNDTNLWLGDRYTATVVWAGRSLGKKASKEMDEVAVEDRLLKVFNNLQRHIKSREFTPDGIEIAGMNGRFVYLKPTGGNLTWEAYENDGGKIEVGSAPLASKWENKVKDILTRVLANPSERVKNAATMPLVFTAPEAIENPNNWPSVFLAGSIDQNQAEDWQKQLIESLAGIPCVVLNPRRKKWDSSWVQSIDNPQFKEQVEWELKGLENATVIAMCLTKDSKAPISLLELGLHATDGKMLVFCPDGFYRKGNVDVVCARYGVPVFGDFDEFTAAVENNLLALKEYKGVPLTSSDRISRRMLARKFVIGLHRTASVVTEKGCLDQLTLALCGHGYSYSEAEELRATACERCRNALAYACGLGYGYPVHSPEWDAANTRCELCQDGF